MASMFVCKETGCCVDPGLAELCLIEPGSYLMCCVSMGF